MGNEVNSLLKWALKIYGVIGVIYGAVFLLFPAGYIAFSGADPIAYVYLRWPGGALVAFGLGCILLSKNPARQGLFVTTVGMYSSLLGLALLYSLLAGEYTAHLRSVIIPIVINLVAAAFIWFGRSQNKEVL